MGSEVRVVACQWALTQDLYVVAAHSRWRICVSLSKATSAEAYSTAIPISLVERLRPRKGRG